MPFCSIILSQFPSVNVEFSKVWVWICVDFVNEKMIKNVFFNKYVHLYKLFEFQRNFSAIANVLEKSNVGDSTEIKVRK